MVSYWIKGISQEDNWQNVCIVYMSECFIKGNNYMVTCRYKKNPNQIYITQDPLSCREKLIQYKK